MKKAIILMTVTALIAGWALGAEMRGVGGTITGVDMDKKAITLESSKDGALTLNSPKEAIMFVQRTATVDDLAEGREVEITGDLNADDTVITAKNIIVYPGTGRGGNRILKTTVTRADGKLKKADGKCFVVVQDKDIAVEMGENVGMVARENATLDKAAVGDRIEMYAGVENGEVQNPTYIVIMKPKAE